MEENFELNQQIEPPTENENMVACKSCSKQIAKKAKACPFCGAKNQKPIYKRVWFWVLIAIVLMFLIIGLKSCGNDTTSSEKNYTVSDSETSKSYDVKENVTESQKIETITKGKTITIPDTCEFFVEYADISAKVIPKQPGTYYRYYEADSGKVYIDVCIGYKNLSETSDDSDEVGSIKVKYANKYEYSGYSIIEEDNRSNLTYTTNIDPLTTEYLHYLVEVPKEVSTSKESIVATLTINGQNFNIEIR